MTKTEVIKFFGNQNRASIALGITRQSVNQWPEDLCMKAQLRVEYVTRGRLKADLSPFGIEKIDEGFRGAE